MDLLRRVALASALLLACPATPASAATNWTVAAGTARGRTASGTISAPATVTAACSGLTTPIVVSWSAVAHATTYTVYKSTGGGAYTSAATINAPTTSWSYSPPGLLQSYTFEVTASVGSNWVSGMSGPSASRSITVLLVCT